MDNKGTGTLYITNKHIIFQSPTSAQKVPYSKMIGVTLIVMVLKYTVMVPMQNVLPFKVSIVGFLMNVISQIANI